MSTQNLHSLLSRIALLLLLTALTVGGKASSLAAPPPPEPGLRLLAATPSGLVLEWTAPPMRVRPLEEGRVEVVADGYAQTAIPGSPRLPYTATLITLPPGISPSLGVEVLEESSAPLPAALATVPQPDGAVRDSSGRPVGPAFGPAVERLPPPPSPVALEEVGVLRGVRLARLTFYPARLRGGRLRVTRRVRVAVRWAPAVGRTGGPLPPDPILAGVRRAVLNPWDVSVRPAASTPSTPARTAGGPIEAFVEVSAPGLYRVTYGDLEPMGFPGADPHNLHLLRGDEEVAYEWEGDDDAVFEQGESILFYAEPRFSRWTNVDVYRLVAETTPGQRMASRPADPSGLPAGTPWVEQLFEENHLYTPDCFCGPLPPGRDGDRWVWAELKRPGDLARSFAFQLAAGDAGSSAALTLWLIGYTSVAAAPDHRVDVSINGIPVGRVEWDGRTAVTATLSIPPGLLREGDNTLDLTLPGIPGVEVEGAWLDGFSVRSARGREPAGKWVRFGLAAGGSPTFPSGPHFVYLPLLLRDATASGGAWAYTVSLAAPGPYRAYDITDPLHPQRLTGFQVDGRRITLGDPVGGGPRRYLVVAEEGVRAPERVRAREDLWGVHTAGGFTGADYVIVTPPAFADALTPLVDLRRDQGLTPRVINLLGIYDAYGDGRPDPEAIRAFLTDSYVTWDPRPTYVLLVGDGSFDPRQYRPDSPPTFVPPYLAEVDPWAGETAADNRYGCVDGDDTLPDLLVGRLPVGSVREAEALVGKIVAYEATPFPGGWNGNVLLVADDPDGAGDFPAFSDDHAAAYVAAPFAPLRRYCTGSSPHVSDCSPDDASSLHAALLSDWNRGGLVVQFAGHSSWQQWAAERLFHLDDVASLYNGRQMPVVVEMTCFTGAFHRPEPTLDEELTLLPGGGAVAAWGPTGLGVGAGHDSLSEGFFRALFVDGVATLGETVLAGKLNLIASGRHLDLVDTFSLLGDPALRWNREIVPWTAQVFLPLVAKEP